MHNLNGLDHAALLLLVMATTRLGARLADAARLSLFFVRGIISRVPKVFY